MIILILLIVLSIIILYSCCIVSSKISRIEENDELIDLIKNNDYIDK